MEATVPPTVRETVEAVRTLLAKHNEGVPGTAVAGVLNLDKSAARRRLLSAARRGCVKNLEEREGRSGRWVPGEPMAEDVPVLPSPDQLRRAWTEAGGGTVARDFGGEKDADALRLLVAALPGSTLEEAT